MALGALSGSGAGSVGRVDGAGDADDGAEDVDEPRATTHAAPSPSASATRRVIVRAVMPDP